MSGPLFVPPEVAVLEPFVHAGVLGATEVHTAATFALVDPSATPAVLLAAALAVRAPMTGSVCVDLAGIAGTVVSAFEAPPEPASEDRPGGTPDGPAPVPADSPTDTVVPVGELDWPDPAGWLAEVRRSPLVADVDAQPGAAEQVPLRPLVVEHDRLYLARYRTAEHYTAADLLQRCRADADGAAAARPSLPSGVAVAARAEIQRLFEAAAGSAGAAVDNHQLSAALAAVERDLVVVSGGPGTGKTTTVARLLAGLVSGLASVADDRRIALAAPTGKAAARMTEAVRGALSTLGDALPAPVARELGRLEAVTIHRLLGTRDGPGFWHGPGNPLPYDVVVVDEVSMVSLSLMAHLLAAIRPDAKVVLVGDPYQLASVEAGTVLGDLVGMGGGSASPQPPPPIADAVRTLGVVHRQGAGSGILELAELVRTGDADAVLALLAAGRPDVSWIDPGGPGAAAATGDLVAAVTGAATEAVTAARLAAGHPDDVAAVAAALEAITRIKVLCAHRRGDDGVEGWNRRVEDALRADGLIGPDAWYSGRPVMVTENDYVNSVFNGDVGVAVRSPAGGHAVWFPRATGPFSVPSARLDRIATQWAMSIHKSQGSEFPHVVVTLPPPPSRILSRELLYTGVTRAKARLTVVAPAEAVAAAVAHPVARASGLAARLAAGTA